MLMLTPQLLARSRVFSPLARRCRASFIWRAVSFGLRPILTLFARDLTSFVGADFEQGFITRALEILLPHRQHFVASHLQQFDASMTDVLVQLDLHSRHLAEWNRQNSLARHFGAVGYRRQYILVSQLRIFSPHFRLGHPAGQEIQNKRYPDARAFDAGLSTADFRIDGNTVQERVQGGLSS